MSEQAPDREQICQRLRRIFGNPSPSTGHDNCWRLHPADPYALTINVHVEDSVTGTSIWIFDPHQPRRDMQQMIIDDDAGLRRAIATIHGHVWRANRQARHAMPALPAPNRRYLTKLLADCRRTEWPEAPCLIVQVKEAMLMTRRSAGTVVSG